jgi:hypothetical protein
MHFCSSYPSPPFRVHPFSFGLEQPQDPFRPGSYFFFVTFPFLAHLVVKPEEVGHGARGGGGVAD